MRTGRLVARSLVFYWRTGVAAALGLGVATAAITGSLVIGDSVRGSLRQTALGRLGATDQALVAPRLFREELAEDLSRDPQVAGVVEKIAPLLQTQGAARHADTGAVASRVTVLGVDDGFAGFHDGAHSFALQGRECLVSAALARDLGLSSGADLVLTLRAEGPVPGDSLFARRALKDAAPSARLRVKATLPDGGAGDFRLDAQSGSPRNVFVARNWLAERLSARGRVNVLLAATKSSGALPALGAGLARACTLADHGLTLATNEPLGLLSLASDATLLTDAQIAAATATAADLGAQASRVSVYLATEVHRVAAPSSAGLAYAMLAGVEPISRPTDDMLGAPGQGEVWLNEWAAQDLGASLGETLELVYPVPTVSGEYPTKAIRLRFAKIVPIFGEAADALLVPKFHGITDSARVADWEPPFPIDLTRITDSDERYWERHRALPKLFVSLETARALWQQGPRGSAADWVTSVRLAPPPGMHVGDFADAYVTRLLESLRPEQAGLRFQPARERALAAARGTSDFGHLFLGLSMFLVASGIGLAGMLLRLSIQQRASQVGMMRATGLPERLVRQALLGEGAVLTIIGGALGGPLGVWYAALIVRALGSWWSGALGAPTPLWLHISPPTIVIGPGAGVVMGLLTAAWSARALGNQPVVALLAAQSGMGTSEPAGRSRAQVALLALSLVAAAALMVLSVGAGTISTTGAFFGIGCCLLAAGLAGASLLLDQAIRRARSRLTFSGLALRNAAANPARSLLVIGLLAAATFVIVAVAASTRDLSKIDPNDRDSGTGGFSLLATSAIPLPYDLSSPDGRRNLGFSAEDEAALAGSQIIGFLESPGEDISCLNIARPAQPRVLGVPDAMIARGGFSILTRGAAPAGGAWALLTAPGDPIPAFGDADSVRWSLHSGLGRLYALRDESGAEALLRFDGLVAGSVFAGELLVAEAHFRRLFPAVSRPSYFLIATEPGRERQVAEVLRRTMGDLGLEVRSTPEVLSSFLRVQNTYLAIFLALGGVGLALGTVGVVIALLRGTLERRGELGLMLACGLRRPAVVRLLLLENGGLMLAGLVLGLGSALIATGPQIAPAQGAVNWAQLSVVMGSVTATALAACSLAVSAVVRGPLIAALRHE